MLLIAFLILFSFFQFLANIILDSLGDLRLKHILLACLLVLFSFYLPRFFMTVFYTGSGKCGMSILSFCFFCWLIICPLLIINHLAYLKLNENGYGKGIESDADNFYV